MTRQERRNLRVFKYQLSNAAKHNTKYIEGKKIFAIEKLDSIMNIEIDRKIELLRSTVNSGALTYKGNKK